MKQLRIFEISENENQFYPTPKSFLDRISEDFHQEIRCFKNEYKYDIKVLEPSAGKGDIAKYLKKYGDYDFRAFPRCDVECIEIDPNFRAMLKGEDFPVIHDDFLSFNTYTKYDLIFMNPPFANADKHLLKAIAIQEKFGGRVLCILNAETLRNLHTNTRLELSKKLSDLNATVKYYSDAFLADDCERKTAVEVAVVWVDVPAPESIFNSKVFEELDKAKEIKIDTEETEEQKQLVRMGLDWIKAAVMQYNEQVNAAISFFKEYIAFSSKYNERYAEFENQSRYNQAFSLKIWGEENADLNHYLEVTRRIYWKTLFDNPNFSGKLTNRLREDLHSRLNDFRKFDFTEKNILLLMEENMKATVRGIEEEILSLFDKLTRHAQYDGCDNVHYYNGWKTNSAHKLNQKIIIPFYGVWKQEARYKVHGTGYGLYCTKNGYEYHLDEREAYRTLSDMSKTLNFLANGICELQDDERLLFLLQSNFKRENAKNIETEHFVLTFYKKGTCHLKFKNQDLLDKFNMFASQRKGWLPPSYGKKAYEDMTEEEQQTINEFQGKERYKEILRNKSAFIVEPEQIMLLSSGIC